MTKSNDVWLVLLGALLLGTAACTAAIDTAQPPSSSVSAAQQSPSRQAGAATGATPGRTAAARSPSSGNEPLPAPGKLEPFPGTPASAGAGAWHPAGRLVAGKAAVYETRLVPPGGTGQAGIAWMDANLLSARLYSGSGSPGGGGYKYTAPVTSAAARSLVAAFNGGFMMPAAHGGYYTEGRTIDPLVRGSASLVIYANGSATVGAWGSDVTMTPSVVAVRQNLFPIVVDGQASARASTRTWRVWGSTWGDVDYQWRSGLGVTGDGALVYVAGSQLDPSQLAALLVRAGAVRGMELDINPSWPVFASYQPATPEGPATPSNGTSLTDTYLGPATFFNPAYARDFVTMSAAPAPVH